MYKEYSQNPGITRSRMYYEAISEALPDVKVYIDTSGENGVQKVLPLESFTRCDYDRPRKRRRMTDEKENRDPLGRAYTGGCVPL